MNKTIRDIEEQIEKNPPEILRDLGLLPEGYRCRARLHGRSRDKRRTAIFEKNWSPDTDSIVLEFERNSESSRPAPPQQEDITSAFDGNPHHHQVFQPEPLDALESSSPNAAGAQVSNQQILRPQSGLQPPNARVSPIDPMADLVRALARAESRPGYAFISLKWFRDTALVSEGFEWAKTDAARQVVLRNAIDQRLILISKYPNPKSPQFPVTAIRLNRLMPEVKAILEIPDDGSAVFKPVSIRGDNLSATILRDRR